MCCSFLSSQGHCSWHESMRRRVFHFIVVRIMSCHRSVLTWRSSKWYWMLQFYIVSQRCLLDMPYHKYHLLFISGLQGPVRSSLKFISKELRGGLSFTVEALAAAESSDRAESIQTRKNNSQIPAAQCPESKQPAAELLSAHRDERCRASSGGSRACCWEITYLHHELVSVMRKYNRFLDNLLIARGHI